MSELLGSDRRRVDLIAEGLRGYSQDIRDVRTIAKLAVAEMRNAWCGQDFERTAQRWEQEVGPRLTDVSSALSTMATVLSAQAEEQRRASGNTSGSSQGKLGSGEALTGATVSGSRTDTGSSTFEGHVTFVDESLVSLTRESDNVRYEVAAGKVEAVAGFSANIDPHGNLVASAGVSAAAYAGYATGALRGGNSFANATAEGKAYVGAEVTADASSSIGRYGAKGHLGAEAFAGGKVEANVGGTVSGVTAMTGGELSYGIGAHAEVDAELSATEVGFSADIGAALGLGVGVKLDVSVNPQEAIVSLGHATGDVSKRPTVVGDEAASFSSW